MRVRALVQAAIAATVVAHGAGPAAAFCGFYVSGAGGELFNDATQVVLMREGTRTVLSMANHYQGPAEDFALVVPVPVVLGEKDVKTLPAEVFARVDQLGAPRLVEYWEQDPCAPQRDYEGAIATGAMGGARRGRATASEHLGVTVEAEFAVGEYQIVILSAKDATGLDTWLRDAGYQIPPGAEPYLRPYVAGGWKFFVAKVDVTKVKYEAGQARLSPLRFHYDADKFELPIRLGMMNSAGTQDLIVNVLARTGRYELANYPNATIPTNLDVRDEARGRFGEFYAALFDRTLARSPGAAITEYAWDASSCDPCPTPALSPGELATLGADVLGGEPASAQRRGRGRGGFGGGFVLTRLHLRYGKAAAGGDGGAPASPGAGGADDLVFKAAQPIAGGREWRGQDGKLEEGAQQARMNNFQARYAIRHDWTGPIACPSPVRGIWGGPPAGQAAQVQAATDLAFVPRGKLELAKLVKGGIPELAVTAAAAAPPSRVADTPVKYPVKQSKGCQVGAGAPGPGGLLVILFLALALRMSRGGRVVR